MLLARRTIVNSSFWILVPNEDYKLERSARLSNVLVLKVF